MRVESHDSKTTTVTGPFVDQINKQTNKNMFGARDGSQTVDTDKSRALLMNMTF